MSEFFIQARKQYVSAFTTDEVFSNFIVECMIHQLQSRFIDTRLQDLYHTQACPDLCTFGQYLKQYETDESGFKYLNNQHQTIWKSFLIRYLDLSYQLDLEIWKICA